MFVLDSLCIAGLRWVLDTVRAAADAELNDDTALRDELLAAEMRRETGELSDDEFASIERELLARIRDIRERRDGGAGPIAFGARVEAIVSCDAGEPEGPVGARRAVRSTPAVRSPRPSARVVEGTVLESVPADPPPGTKRTTRPTQTRGTTRTKGAPRGFRARRTFSS
ncbi:MAG: gas vesicle protein GvpG [Vicinamibacterales bacterium]